MDYLLSQKNSKLLQEWGCTVESEYVWAMKYPYSVVLPGPTWEVEKKNIVNMWEDEDYIGGFPTYHLLEDICCEKAKEFFGDEILECEDCGGKYFKEIGAQISGFAIECVKCRCLEQKIIRENLFCATWEILQLCQQGNKKEAEKYFMENNIFNPFNK